MMSPAQHVTESVCVSAVSVCPQLLRCSPLLYCQHHHLHQHQQCQLLLRLLLQWCRCHRLWSLHHQ